MIKQRLQKVNREFVTNNIREKGFSVIPNLLTDEECNELAQNYTQPNTYRKTVVMERYRFGLGEYKYFDYPLPNIIHQIRTEMYPHLAPIANLWFKALKMDTKFPLNHAEFLEECHENGQQKATVLILKYGKGGYNTLHQDLYGDIYFPIQTVLFLSGPDKDFTGGEFVLTQQIPRAQSKVTVLKPKKGDLLVFTTNFKPEKGKKAIIG